MTFREETSKWIFECFEDWNKKPKSYYDKNTADFLTDIILSKFEKVINEEIDNLAKKCKEDKLLFLDGECLHSNIRILEKIKVLLK